MRALAAAVLLTCGCRQLLGLDDLPGDAAPDGLDVDPSKLALTGVTPAVLREGIGTASRPAVLVVRGMHIVAGATVEIRERDGGDRSFAVDSSQIRVSQDGTMLAFPTSVAPDPALANGVELHLDLIVTQPVGADLVSQTLSQTLVLAGLDELRGGSVTLTSGVHEYSQIDAAAISAATPADGPVILRSMSTVRLTGTASVNASGQSGGAGGGNGGAGGGPLGGMGQQGIGMGGGLPSGGGGSYATKGGGSSPGPVGNAALPTLDAPNRGSGGGGGNGNGSPNPGGAGGGGGGTIEITGRGMLTLVTVQARGGNGANAGADDGGGGSGGTILLRSGDSVTATSLDVAGGSGMNAGGLGRIRVDAPGTVPAQTTPAYYRGPTLAAETPLIVSTAQPMLAARGQPVTTFSYFVRSLEDERIRGPFPASFGPSGEATFELAEPLFEGLNRVCVVVEGGELDRAEAQNCLEVAYLF